MPVYLPEHGGMFFKAGALGCYDPQIIKPPEGYRGADSVVMEAAAEEKKPEVEGEVTV
jgi:NNP family nitrate/nitrite transporter-like MFS transporter